MFVLVLITFLLIILYFTMEGIEIPVNSPTHLCLYLFVWLDRQRWITEDEHICHSISSLSDVLSDLSAYRLRICESAIKPYLKHLQPSPVTVQSKSHRTFFHQPT